MQPRPVLPMTAESLRLAKEYNAREREAARKLGLIVDEDGTTRLDPAFKEPDKPENCDVH